jgi:hypothetical protein
VYCMYLVSVFCVATCILTYNGYSKVSPICAMRGSIFLSPYQAVIVAICHHVFVICVKAYVGSTREGHLVSCNTHEGICL